MAVKGAVRGNLFHREAEADSYHQVALPDVGVVGLGHGHGLRGQNVHLPRGGATVRLLRRVAPPESLRRESGRKGETAVNATYVHANIMWRKIYLDV